MKIKVEVFSDYVCPFCFVGSSRVGRLKKEFEDLEVEWKGFEIHPEVPPQGITMTELFDNDYFEKVWTSVKKLADDANIDIKPPSKIVNSKRALEASEYAKEKGKFDKFHKAVFKAYFQEDRDIGDMEVLIDVGKRIGLDTEELRNTLEKGIMRRKIEHYYEEVKKNVILGVPTFIIGEKKIVGAQPYEVLKKAVEEISLIRKLKS